MARAGEIPRLARGICERTDCRSSISRRDSGRNPFAMIHADMERRPLGVSAVRDHRWQMQFVQTLAEHRDAYGPRPWVAMKLITAGVTCSAAITRSPSFSRFGASTKTTISPRAIAATASSTLARRPSTASLSLALARSMSALRANDWGKRIHTVLLGPCQQPLSRAPRTGEMPAAFTNRLGQPKRSLIGSVSPAQLSLSLTSPGTASPRSPNFPTTVSHYSRLRATIQPRRPLPQARGGPPSDSASTAGHPGRPAAETPALSHESALVKRPFGARALDRRRQPARVSVATASVGVCQDPRLLSLDRAPGVSRKHSLVSTVPACGHAADHATCSRSRPAHRGGRGLVTEG